MARTFRNLYPQVVSFENLWLAYRKTLRGKRYKEAAIAFDMAAEENILQLQRELKEKTWRPGGHGHFYVYEPKRRRISAAPFRDRLLHRALVNLLEPIYEARFSESSYACRKDKGTHAAIERGHWGIRNCAWFLKGDVVKFFPSVDHEVMKAVLFRKIGDADVRSCGMPGTCDGGRQMFCLRRSAASPSGRQRIARRFIGGMKPVRAAENSPPIHRRHEARQGGRE